MGKALVTGMEVSCQITWALVHLGHSLLYDLGNAKLFLPPLSFLSHIS